MAEHKVYKTQIGSIPKIVNNFIAIYHCYVKKIDYIVYVITITS